MKNLIPLVLVLGFFTWTAPLLGDTKTPTACALINEKDAVELLGGPLGEVYKEDIAPAQQNDFEHTTVCGFFPKGYKIQEADRPPERGIMLQLHAFQTGDKARKFYDIQVSLFQKMIETPNGPSAGAKISPLAGFGDSAFLQSEKVEIDPKTAYQIAILVFVKGSVMGQVQVWKAQAPVNSIAQSAARKVISKLP